VGGCASLLRTEEDALQPIGALGGETRVAGIVRQPGGRRRTACRGSDRQHPHEGAPLGRRRKRGALLQAVGLSRGGHNSRLHALTDGEGRPLRFLLTGGQLADCRAADVLLDDLAPRAIVLAFEACNSNAIRELIERQGAAPKFPRKSNRCWKAAFHDPLQRAQCRRAHVLPPQGHRRAASRYDKLASNIISAIYLAAAVKWWL
jgi:transposase